MVHRASRLMVVGALSCCPVPACSVEAEDEGGAVQVRVDAGGGGAGGGAEAGPLSCDPIGTWRLTHTEGCGRKPSLLFVASYGSGYSAHFVGVRPEGPVGFRYFAAYDTEAYFDPATCQLIVELEVRDQDTGEGINGSSPVYLFDVRQEVATVSVMERFRGGPCDTTATRVSGPGHCPERAVHGDACEVPGPCDTGCGSPCECLAGRWACEFPTRGAPCLTSEGCAAPGEDGGLSSLTCRPPLGSYFDGTLTAGGDLCTSYPPVAGERCQPHGFTCGSCTCLDPERDGWPAWECDPPDGG